MTAALTLRAYTGTNAGTESAAQSSLVLCAADALSGGSVAPGTNSYERWTRLRVDSPPALGVANFAVTASGDLPDGVVIRFGVTDTPATPVNTTSSVATNELAMGRLYLFDANQYGDTGDHTRYLVFQEVVAADADPGAVGPLTLSFGYVEA